MGVVEVWAWQITNVEIGVWVCGKEGEFKGDEYMCEVGG